MQTPDAALQLLTLAQEQCGADADRLRADVANFACDWWPNISRNCRARFRSAYPQYVLLEVSDSESEEHAVAMLEGADRPARWKTDMADDAVVATSIAQSRALWDMREHIPLAQADEGKNIKHDVSLPISRIGDFIHDTDALLADRFPGMPGGHASATWATATCITTCPRRSACRRTTSWQPGSTKSTSVVHDSVHRFHGSISAEHGLGAFKREEIKQYKSAVELRLMGVIKDALDPLHLMNPGKVL